MTNREPEAKDHPLPEKALKELFAQSHDRGRAGLPLMSLSMGRGLVPRNQDERRVETNLSHEEHRLVRAGDLAYNMMRMWQGVCSLAEEDCLVSPAYVVVRPLDGMHPKFSEYLLSYEETVAQFKRLSFGVVDDRLRLYYKDFERVRVKVPSPAAQWKIANILTTLDNLIEKTEVLIAKYQALKQGMMHDLYTRGVDEHGHLRPPYAEAPNLYKPSPLGWIPRQWEAPKVGEVVTRRPKNGYSPQESNDWTGTLMLGLSCLTPEGFEPIQLKNAPTNDPNIDAAILNDGDLLISRSNTRELVGLVGRYRDVGVPCIYSDLMMRLVPTNDVLPEFLETVLRHSPVRRQLTNASCGTSGSMMKINAEMVVNTVIVLPNEDEQRELLRRSESAKLSIFRSKCQLDKYKQIRSGLKQDLLTGNIRVHVDPAEEAAHA